MGRTVAARAVEAAEGTEEGAESAEVAETFRALGANVGAAVRFRASAERLAAPAPFSGGILSLGCAAVVCPHVLAL